MNIWTGEVSATRKKNSSLSSIPRPSREPESNTCYTVPLNLNVALSKTDWTRYRALPSWRLTDPLEIAIHRVPFDENRTLIRCERIVLRAVKTECGEYFIAEFEDLEMSLWGESMEELKDAFGAVLAMTWEIYAMGDPNEMDRGALKLRNHLRSTYRLAPTV